MKYCSGCKDNKSIDDFHKTNLTKDKRQSWCKVCMKNSTTLERRVFYNENRKERRKVSTYTQNEYDLGKLFRVNNREKYLWKGIKVRSKNKNLPCNILPEDIVIPDVCPVLGIVLTKDTMSMGDWNAPSVDKIIPELGYTKGNIMVMSRKANTMKNNATIKELRNFSKFFLKFTETH